MRKVVKSLNVSVVTPEQIRTCKMVVGLFKKQDKLVLIFPFYIDGMYKINTSYHGRMNNYGGFPAKWRDIEDLHLWMADNCEFVYEIDSWTDLADIITLHKPFLEQSE